MRGWSYRIIILLYLPLQILCLGIKLEGLIDLGPKWDYAYKLTPIKTDLEEYEKENVTNNLNIIRTDRKQDRISTNKEYFVTESDLSKKQLVHIHDTRQGDLSEFVVSQDVSENNETHDKNDSSSESQSDDRKYTKQDGGSRNTRFTDDFNDNGGSNDAELSIDKLTTLNAINYNKNNNANKLIIQGNINESLLRIKSKRIDRKMKDNKRIKEFTIHIFNQSLDIFDKMKKSTDDERTKRKLKELRRSYIEKFGDFLKQSEDFTLKTKLANQNVILHTIDVNNSILKRIVNYLSEGDDKNKARLSGVVNIFRNEVEKERVIENKHACTKLSICRSDEEYTDFIISILDIILLTDKRKLKQASDALTESVKTSDFTNIIDNQIQDRLRKLMTKIESWDPFITRSMFLMLRNVLAHKNLPIIIMHASELEAINNTIYIHELIHILNINMGTVENRKEWKDIKNRMQEWSDGKRRDVQKTINLIIRQIINVLEKTDIKIRDAINNTMMNLLGWTRLEVAIQ